MFYDFFKILIARNAIFYFDGKFILYFPLLKECFNNDL